MLNSIKDIEKRDIYILVHNQAIELAIESINLLIYIHFVPLYTCKRNQLIVKK